MSHSLSWRLRKDRWATRFVSVGGSGVIAAVALIFFYLLYEVVPMFRGADMQLQTEYQQSEGAADTTVHLAVEEQGEIGLRISQSGRLEFFNTVDGVVLQGQQLPIAPATLITSVAGIDPDGSLLVLGLGNGSLLALEISYRVKFVDDQRELIPEVNFPYGEQPIEVSPGTALVAVAVQREDEQTTLVAAAADGNLHRVQFVVEASFLGFDDDELEPEPVLDRLGRYQGVLCRLLLDRVQRQLYVARCDGSVDFYALDEAGAELIETRALLPVDTRLTAFEFVSGTYSLLAGDSRGQVWQWFPVRDQHNQLRLQRVRGFKALAGDSPVARIVVEQRRKGFAVLAEDGRFGLYSATAERQLLTGQLDSGIAHLVFAPRADYLLAETSGGGLQYWQVDNDHPEISLSALWQEVWYESYPEPDYVWQSSAATSDFEPKFSLTPLVFGTIKSAFYAMLFAVPLAVMAAIYTGYFMHPKMRGWVKPAIENMGALPTVVIGFLAGLWLAPVLEQNLPGFFALLIAMPVAVLVTSLGFYCLPAGLRNRIPKGLEGLFLVPLLLLVGWLCLSISGQLESWLFSGDVRAWITTELGLDYDQRNSIVVGIAMGIAVIPTIYSMAEDAIFSVPKFLTQGSLALGATDWQTLSRVVILTASPGIFSAVMLGLGRAVGETMIVLMATGNTPIMDFNIFNGMRTLAANIAVEVPESAVGSTHYRVLFLAALVLFALTFLFNTVAELVRQRLRERYSSL